MSNLDLDSISDAAQSNANLSPALKLMCNRVSVGLALVKIANTLGEADDSRAHQMLAIAERALASGLTEAQQLIESERGIAISSLDRLRAALAKCLLDSESEAKSS